MPLVHLHTFLVLSFLYATWAVGGGRLREAWASLGWALVPATWAVWQVSDGFGAAALVGWKPGWTIGDDNPVVFLLVNFGLFLPLAVAALLQRLWKSAPHAIRIRAVMFMRLSAYYRRIILEGNWVSKRSINYNPPMGG